MKIDFEIPRYNRNTSDSNEFFEMFTSKFYQGDPIEIMEPSTNHNNEYDKYVRDLYFDIESRFKKHENFQLLLDQYLLFKNSYPVHLRWRVYEFFVDLLIEIEKFDLAFNEWKNLQEEEWEGWNRDFTYRDSAIKRLIDFEVLLGKSLINGDFIHKMAPKGHQLTKFGKRNRNDVFRTLDSMVKINYDNSFFELFFKSYSPKSPMKLTPFPRNYYSKFFQKTKNSKVFWESIISDNNNSYFFYKNGNPKFEFVCHSIREYSSNLLREAENEYRLLIGANKVGESWIGETELYYKLKNYYSEIQVIHQGNPKWLGRQKFDVWIPSIKVAIEYQGAQHDRPIEFFGGQDAFIKNQIRDEKKKKKSAENGVTVIEVRSGYDFAALIEKIEELRET